MFVQNSSFRPDLSEDEEYDKSLIVTPAGTIIRESKSPQLSLALLSYK